VKADGRSRVVVVIGASSGIGLAAALGFAERGDHLVLVARSEEALRNAQTACLAAGARTAGIAVAVVAVQSETESAIEQALAFHGRVDVVVLTATVMAYRSIETIPAEVFRRVVETSILGTGHVARAVLPMFRRQGCGSLVVVNSLLGSVVVPHTSAYAAAKWGQRALVRTLQQENRKEHNVHICLVSPGSVNTPIYYQAANYLGREVRPPWPVMSPQRVASVITGLADRPRGHVSVPVGVGNPIVIAGFRVLPFIYDRIVGSLFRLACITRRHAQPTSGNVISPRPALERMHGHWPDRNDAAR
jgi:NAD(P)-dependent dehydrogenase (short-subunit alcohol dehydrogenase family)